MARLRLVTGSLGNVSARGPEGFCVTPSRIPYAQLRRRDMVWISPDAVSVVRGGNPSIEWPMHREVYRRRQDVGAIVHTHSIHAMAWAFRGAGELPALEDAAYYGLGRVAVSEPAVAGSDALGVAAADALGAARAALIGNHGVVAVGADPAEALAAAIVVERQAAVAWLLEGSSLLAT